jgi:dihydroorotase
MILKNCKILIDKKLVKKDILIEGNLIKKIEDYIDGDDVIDVNGCFVMPGATDVHVHLREPGYEYKETIKSGTLSAAKGGVTTVLAMPNLNPCPHNEENIKLQLELIKRDALVNVYPYGAVSKNQKGELIADIEELAKITSFITDDGVGVNNIEILRNAMVLAKKHNIVLASHAEDTVDSKLPQGEYVAVKREIELAKEIGCRYHFLHMSTKESFDLIRKAHQEGYTNITCEVAPHHLVLNEEMIKNGNWKMNPPLRSEQNRLETIKALLDGTAIIVASDHAPHSEVEKSREYDKCLNGIIGLETMLPLVYTTFIDTNMASLNDFVDWFVTNPNKVFSLEERKVEEGYVADLTVLNLDEKRIYTKEEILSKGKNSPYIGMELKGYPVLTICNGKVVWRA